MSVDISTSRPYELEPFLDRYTVETAHGKARVMRFIPPKLMHAEGLVSSRPVVLSHGWGESTDSTAPLAEELARNGYDTTIFDYPKMNHKIVKSGEVLGVRYEVFSDVVDTIAADEIDVAAHSEGAYEGLAAVAYRDDIHAALLAAPGGLSGTFRFSELVMCGAREGLQAVNGTRHNALGMFALARAGFGLAANVIGRPQLSLAEVHAIATTDALPMLDVALNRGAKIGILACRRDRIFPAERIEVHLDGRENKITRWTVLDTTHFDFLQQELVRQQLLAEADALFREE